MEHNKRIISKEAYKALKKKFELLQKKKKLLAEKRKNWDENQLDSDEEEFEYGAIATTKQARRRCFEICFLGIMKQKKIKKKTLEEELEEELAEEFPEDLMPENFEELDNLERQF